MPTYEARGSFVIIRRRPRDTVRGLAMPDVSIQSKDFVVESCGHKVEKLKPGDVVMIAGKAGETYFDLPDDSERLVIDERLVPYIIHRSEDEE